MARVPRNIKPRVEEDENFAVAGEGEGRAVSEGAPPVLPPKEDKLAERLARQQRRAEEAEPTDDARAALEAWKQRRMKFLGPERHLTRKQQAGLADWNTKNRGKRVDTMIKARVEEARKKFGHSGVFHGKETGGLLVGIPMPSLAMEFVMSNDVFPLSVVMQLVGRPASGKSGLLAELFRWFNSAGGLGIVNENETKFDPQWYRSIMGAEWFDEMQLNRCSSIEDWQDRVSDDIGGYKKLLIGTRKDPGPGRSVPVLYGVDSVMGKLCEESQQAVIKKGHAARGYPLEAQVISRYLKTVPQMLDGWPFTLVLVNHLRVKKNEDTGHDERLKSGGEQLSFQESWELEIKRVGPRKIETEEVDGFFVEVSNEKNSFGYTGRRVRTRVLRWEELNEKTGLYELRTKWDWDWATVHLLHSVLEGGERNVRLRRILKDTGFDMTFNSPTAFHATAYSKYLGVSQKDPLSWQEMGALIRKDLKVTEMLRTALRINRRPILGSDYLAQIQGLARELP